MSTDVKSKTPPFALGYPEHEALERLVATFEQGDYAKVREGAEALFTDPDPDVQTAARDLATRTTPDPSTKVLFALAALLLVGLSVYWVQNDGPDPHAKPQKPEVELVK